MKQKAITCHGTHNDKEKKRDFKGFTRHKGQNCPQSSEPGFFKAQIWGGQLYLLQLQLRGQFFWMAPGLMSQPAHIG